MMAEKNIFVYPEQGEIVVATVKKITTYGAFCSLDEYGGVDAFVHISEVSSGWVRNVRDHVKEGQKIAAQVLRVDETKRQIDLSLKRIGEGEKKRKLDIYNLDKRALKLLERVATKLGKKPAAVSEVVPIIKEEYGDLYTVFENASEGKPLPSKLPKPWVAGITEVAKVEIKEKLVTLRTALKIKSYASDGVEQVKKILQQLTLLSKDTSKVSVHYLGAPNYFLDFAAPDFKTAEKNLAKAQELAAKLSVESTECQIERIKEAS